MSTMRDLELLRAACCVAGLDGEITDRERAALEVLVEKAGVGQASFKAMLQVSIEDKNHFRKQLEFFKDNPDATIKTLFQVAVIDGTLGENERVVMQYFADKLKVPPERYAEILAAAEREAQS